ncbi:MAG TPA: hypothetical protein DEQ47_15615 [Solibacterales bacterium]|nr:hypothetical protein [Bryobacterales bacterium]
MNQTNEQKLTNLAAEVSKLSHLAKLQQERLNKLHDAVAGHQKIIEALNGQLQASTSRPRSLGNSLN